MQSKQSKVSDTIIPEPIDVNLRGCALTINARCGQCRHFKRIAHPALEVVCKNKGILETNKPCVRFDPEISYLKMSEKTTRRLAISLATIPQLQLTMLAAVFNREARTRKRGFFFGQPVYIKIFVPDYISNYMQCLVVSADTSHVHVTSHDGKFQGTMTYKSILTHKQWLKKKKELEAKRKIKDPNWLQYFVYSGKRQREINKVVESHEAPDIDANSIRRDKRSSVMFGKNLNAVPIDRLLQVRG